MARGMSVMAMNPYGPNWIDKALEVAGGIGNIRGKQLSNEEQRIKNAFLPQQTQSGLNLLGAKTALEEMQPDMLRAQMRNLDARSQLARAQAQFQGLGKDPLEKYRALYAAYESAESGSPQKELYAALLNKEMGISPELTMNAQVGGLGATPSEGGVEIPSGGQPLTGLGASSDLQVNPYSIGSRSKRGAQTGRVAPDGTFETFESPTTTSAGRNQMRREAEAEMETVYPFVQQAASPYYGLGGQLKFAQDVLTARLSPNSKKGKEAAKRLEEYQTASSYFNELANIVARQSSGASPGVEAMREMKDSLFPNLPGRFLKALVPNQITARAMKEYMPLQEEATNAALDQERGGYQKNLGEAPYWAAQEPQFIPGMFTGQGFQQPRTIQPQRQPPPTSERKPSIQNREQQPEYSQADLEFTAKKHGMTIDQVKQALGIQ